MLALVPYTTSTQPSLATVLHEDLLVDHRDEGAPRWGSGESLAHPHRRPSLISGAEIPDAALGDGQAVTSRAAVLVAGPEIAGPVPRVGRAPRIDRRGRTVRAGGEGRGGGEGEEDTGRAHGMLSIVE